MSTPYNTDTTASLWKLQLLRLIQILGFFSLALGGAEVTNLINVMPQIWGAKLMALGPIILASKPVLQMFGDWLDDGVRNDSFKLPVWAVFFSLLTFGAVAAMTLPLVSCATLATLEVRKDPDGYLMIGKTNPDGSKYFYGSVTDRNGKVIAYRIEWTTKEGVHVRYRHNNLINKGDFQYQLPDGIWVTWDSKSGIVIGDPPMTLTPLI